MPARILDGKALAQSIRDDLAGRVARFTESTGIVPGLAVVLIGQDPASEVYVRNKQRAAKAAGMVGTLHRVPADASEGQILDKVDELNADAAVHGFLVQSPLPRHVDEARVVDRIDPLKDVDGFHAENAGLLAIGRPRFVPCTPLGVRELLVAAGIETRGARAVVLGRSNIVGKPMALLLMQRGPGGDATVTVVHTATRDAPEIARDADILIAAIGKPRAVTADWIRPGATVIDVGIHRLDDGGLCGDVDFEPAKAVAGAITPVPGGVGAMTVAMLLRNTFDAASRGNPS